MKLSTKVRYGLRAVFDIAYNHAPGESGQVKEIARRQNISPGYLEQIFFRMKKHGIIRSERGPRGGYALARPASDITIGDIYRATEGDIAIVDCATSACPACDQEKACVVHPVWTEINADIAAILDRYTIEDLRRRAADMDIPSEIDKKFIYII